MSFAPFLAASPTIQIHAIAATLALVLGPVAIYRDRRDALHKWIGYIWVIAMLCTALSSFGIRAYAVIGPFSPIHILSCLAIWSIWVGMRYIYRGNIRAHRKTFQSLYWNGVLVAALFNFLPGRIVNRLFFNDAREIGWVVIGAGGAFLVGRILLSRQSFARLT